MRRGGRTIARVLADPRDCLLAVGLALAVTVSLAGAQDVGSIPKDTTPAVPEADSGPNRPFSTADIPAADTEALLSFYEVFSGQDNARATALKAAIAAELDKRTPGWRGSPSPSTNAVTTASSSGNSSPVASPATPTPSSSTAAAGSSAGVNRSAQSRSGTSLAGGSASALADSNLWKSQSLANSSLFWLSVPGGSTGHGPRWIWDPITGKKVDLEEHTAQVGVFHAAEDELANTDRTGAVARPLTEK